MAPFPASAFQEGRWRPLLRTLCAFRRAAADAEFHAQEIWGAHFRTRFADRTRIEIGDLSGPDAFERNQGGAISRTRPQSLRISRRTLTRNNRNAGKGNA